MVTLADAILAEDLATTARLMQYGEDVNQIDEYGFTPLTEAAIVEHIPITRLLLSSGAEPNRPDVTGGTALHWAAENNNLALCELLLKHHADPNAYNLAGQSALVMPMLRRQSTIRQLLIRAGADELFAEDYINAKLLGHLFELVGTVNIVDPNHQLVEVDLEGFYLEITISLIADSLAQFQNHFQARELRRFGGISQYIVDILQRASQLIKFQQYRVDVRKHEQQIRDLLQIEPLLIPIGYEGHAITFVKYGNIWAKCDRREDSRLYDNIFFYLIENPAQPTVNFLKNLIYQKQSSDFINEDLHRILQLRPLTELKVDAQVSGNCSWANVEAAIPTLFFLVMLKLNQPHQAMGHFKSMALHFFHRWREWNKDRALHYCMRSFSEANPIRKACKAEILAAILFQRLGSDQPNDRERIHTILNLLLKSPYEYILKNYLRVYYYEGLTDEGRQFAELLKSYNFPV